MKFPQATVIQVVKELIEDVSVVKQNPQLVMNGRCPICGDSKKSKRKKRFWIHENADWYSIICYNCNASTNLYTFLKTYHPERLEQLKVLCFDQIKEGNIFKKEKTSKRKIKKPTSELDTFLRKFFDENCFLLDHKQNDKKKEKLRQFAVEKMKERNIKKKFWSSFYFCYKGKYTWRVVIPFEDDLGLLYYFQARDICPKPNELKYLTSSFEDVKFPDNRIYNFYNVDKNKIVLICEGMLDSLFIDNGIALCNANIQGYNIDLIKNNFSKRVWIMDNPMVDETGFDRIMSLLDKGEKCFIMPTEHIDCKDLNDLAIKLNVEHIDYSFIKENLLEGKSGQMKLKVLAMQRGNYE